MIQMQSLLAVADNTGAKQVMCIKVPGGSKRRSAGIGDVIVCSVRATSPKSNVKKKTVVKAVIVRSKSGIGRKDGSRVRFDDNAVVLINDNGEPRGTRVFGPIARECRDRGYQKIISLAPDVV